MHDVSSRAPRPTTFLLVGMVAVVLVAGGCSPNPAAAAPEAARPMHGTNTLKPVPAPAQSCHDQTGAFPMGNPFASFYPNMSRGTGQSCFLSMLPQFEQQSLFNAYNFSWTAYNIHNA